MKNKVGVLAIGVLGHLATTVVTGALALKKGISQTTGMVTKLSDFCKLELVEPENMVFGGWDIRKGTILESARHILSEIPYFGSKELFELEKELSDISGNIYPGISTNCGEAIEALASDNGNNAESIKDTVNRLKENINTFKEKNSLDTVVVVNLSSTEPPFPSDTEKMDLMSLNRLIEGNSKESIRAGTLYAYAAVDSGCPYINFTPSDSALLPGLIELAVKRGVPVMGNDGKTGETLVKSALAPMFACRNLNVLSWEGYNLLGNMDGKVLSNSENGSTKKKSKDKVLSKILGYKPHSKVSIDYVPSLGDRKTAWDYIHFEGFLNTKMSLQFTWQGCDSALAAPLVLDLVRLSFFAYRNHEKGLLKHLACFFKSPLGVEEYNLHKQYEFLLNYVENNLAN